MSRCAEALTPGSPPRSGQNLIWIGLRVAVGWRLRPGLRTDRPDAHDKLLSRRAAKLARAVRESQGPTKPQAPSASHTVIRRWAMTRQVRSRCETARGLTCRTLMPKSLAAGRKSPRVSCAILRMRRFLLAWHEQTPQQPLPFWKRRPSVDQRESCRGPSVEWPARDRTSWVWQDLLANCHPERSEGSSPLP